MNPSNSRSAAHRRSRADITRVDDAAASWYARVDAGLTPVERAEFASWLVANPRHEAAWREFETTLGALDLNDQARVRGWSEQLAGRKRRRRRRYVAGVGSALMVLAGVWFGWHPSDATLRPRADSAGFVRSLYVQRQALPDGTQVELERGTHLVVNFSPTERRVRLDRGMAYFAVAHAPDRPFVVDTDGAEVRAVGTAFSVDVASSEINVLVTEGKVAVACVEPSTMTAEPVEVAAGAGSRVTIPRGAAGRPPRVLSLAAEEMQAALAWRTPRLEFNGTSLAEAVAAFNQAGMMQLRIGDSALAELKLSGVFRSDNAAGFARILELNYGIQVERWPDVLVLRSAR